MYEETELNGAVRSFKWGMLGLVLNFREITMVAVWRIVLRQIRVREQVKIIRYR
jgi:hypothetical protein